MDWKEFFRPTPGKVILFFLLFLFFPYLMVMPFFIYLMMLNWGMVPIIIQQMIITYALSCIFVYLNKRSRVALYVIIAAIVIIFILMNTLLGFA